MKSWMVIVLKVILYVPFVKKTMYIRHLKFLPRNHPYHRMKITFNGSHEDEVVSSPYNEETYNQVKNIDIGLWKHQKKNFTKKNIQKKWSIFFNLSYWCKLDVWHCINVVHVEKMYMIVSWGQDLVDMSILSKLHP